jgi:hypothetical protein
MAWYDRLKFRKGGNRADESDVSVVSEYPIETVEAGPERPNWLMLAALSLAALAFAVLVVYGGRAAYRHWHHPIQPAPANSKNSPQPPPTDLKPDKNTSGSGGSSSSGTGTTNKPSTNLPTTGG